MKNKFLTICTLVLLNACGGGSGSDSDGKVFEGMLTQGQAIDHASRSFKHGENEPIEEVKICAFGRCSTTDGEGQFGFVGPSEFKGGEILFTVDGHGILAEAIVSVPESAKSVFMHFEANGPTEVHLHHMEVDGVRVEAHADHTEDTHSHD